MDNTHLSSESRTVDFIKSMPVLTLGNPQLLQAANAETLEKGESNINGKDLIRDMVAIGNCGTKSNYLALGANIYENDCSDVTNK